MFTSGATHMRTPFKMKWPDVQYLELANATVCGPRGLILKENGSLFEEGTDEHIYWLPRTMPSSQMNKEGFFSPEFIKERSAFLSIFSNEIKTIAHRNSKVVKLDAAFVYVDLTHPFGWYAFGHLHDSLQRLFSLRDNPHLTEIGKVKFLVCRYDRVNDFIGHLSAMLRRPVTTDELIVLQQGMVYSVPRLIKPAMPSVYTNFTPDVYSWMMEGYRSRFDFSQPDGSKLYLSRNHIKPGFRGVLNESELLHGLDSLGFTCLYGNESLEEIIFRFSSASLIVGPHGSLFANTIFCHGDCFIVEYCPKNRPDYSFYKKTKSASNYKHILLDADAQFNIEISLESIVNGNF